jgi:Protein of unknown function (DUF2582)
MLELYGGCWTITGVWNTERLKRLSGLSDRELNMAVGWLAREDRIQIDSYIENGKEYYYLELNLYIG